MSKIKVEEAKRIIGNQLSGFQGKVKEVPLYQCLGMYLAEDIEHIEGNVGYEEACLKKGHRVRPIEVGFMASLGKLIVPVFERPLVSIISVGDELVSIIEEPAPGKVRDSSSFALAALVQETGCDMGGVYLLKDEKNTLEETLQEALNRSDLVLVSGGISQEGTGITGEAIEEIGEPGIMVNGLDLKYAEDTVLGIIEDKNCACCKRKSLIVSLPLDTRGVFAAYNALIDGIIKDVFFSHSKSQDSEIKEK